MVRSKAYGTAWQRRWRWLRPWLTLRRVRARLLPTPFGRLPRLVVNGFPKAGTHLLVRCVQVLGGKRQVDLVYVHRRLKERIPPGSRLTEGDGVPLGVGHLTFFPAREVERQLASLWGGEFAAGHIPYSDRLVELLERHGMKMLLIVRDPRDVAVSHMYHVLGRPGTRRHRCYVEMLKTPEAQLLASIEGMPGSPDAAGRGLRSIGERLASVMPWLKVPLNYTTHFERLVGPHGGGSEEDQQREIANIARHLGMSLAPEQIRSVAAQLFGQGSRTFRRGQIGSWREHFKPEHKEAFKRVAGQHLVGLGYERGFDW